MDAVALADTNNPTMHNPSCTVCHTVMDPVAGAFQDYGDDGFYRDQWGGMDSLHEIYKEDYGTQIECRGRLLARSGDAELAAVLAAGTQTMKVTFTNHFWDEAARESGGAMYLDRLDVLDDQGRRVTSVEFEDVDVPVAPWGDDAGHRGATLAPEAGTTLNCGAGYIGNAHCVSMSRSRPPANYTAEVIAWSNGHDERYGDDGYARLASHCQRL